MSEIRQLSPEQRFISEQHPHVLEAKALMARPIKEVPFVVFDVETTGFRSDKGDRVIEIALYRINPGAEPVQLTYVLNPGIPIEDDIFALTHISQDEIDAAPRFADVIHDIRAILSGAVLVAHNAKFDLGFLRVEFGHQGETPPVQPVIDTLELAKKFKFPNNRLTTVAAELGVEVRPDAHRAFADVDMTVQILHIMTERIRAQGHDIQTVQDLMNHSGRELLSVPTISGSMVHDIRAAILTGEVFSFKYKKSGQKKPEERHVKVTSFDGAYVVGMDIAKGEERQFRIDRMSL